MPPADHAALAAANSSTRFFAKDRNDPAFRPSLARSELRRSSVKKHPGAFVYRTKGGYRIVYLTSRSWHIVDSSDDWGFACYYAAVCRYLERSFTIHADTSCGQWTRLFRAPHATRDRAVGPEQRETI